MTVNEQLRRASDQIQQVSRGWRVPQIPVARGLITRILVSAGLAVGIVFLLLAAFRPQGPDPEVAASSADVALVRGWIEGAMAGEFSAIGKLTYGEHREPVALMGLARLFRDYRLSFGEPTLVVTSFDTEGTDLVYTCVTVDFGEFAIEGGMVLRDWPEQGRKLWEFRNAMEGCQTQPLDTTTLPVTPN